MSCLAISFVALSAQAQQTPPDAGSLLRQQPTPPTPATPQAPRVEVKRPDISQYTGGPKFLVKEFRFVGVSLVSEAELQERFAYLRDNEVTLGLLQAAANGLTGYYLQKGFVARVLIPQQNVRDGVVEIRVIEGRRGAVVVENNGKRVDASRVTGFVNESLPEGAPFNTHKLQSAIDLLNEQPGVAVASAMRPGAQESDVDVVISAADKPLLGTAIGVNNNASGAKSTAQAQAGFTLYNPTGRFDSASLLLNGSDGNIYVRADYSLAVGSRGLRIGANASRLEYRLTQEDFKSLNLHGNANTYSVNTQLPLVRASMWSLLFAASHDVKLLVDNSVTGEVGNRKVSVTSVGLSGKLAHELGDYPVDTNGVVTLHSGKSDERNSGALASDAAGRRVNGRFGKLSYSLNSNVELAPSWAAAMALRGQFSRENLDSSERISLGGSTGVRAYPGGEASGDAGWLLNLSLRRVLGDGLAASMFYDVGAITANKTLWPGAGVPGQKNHYSLSGVGLGLEWRFMANAQLTAFLATPLGSNPGRDANNRNSDGKENGTRFWISVNAQF